MSAIIWTHVDALSREHPVFDAAPEGARAIYIWDAEDVERRGWSLKRCVFVLECLDEMGVEIVEGGYVDTLASMETNTIFTAETPDPLFRSVIEQFEAKAIEARSFTDLPANADMGRFFRYWNKAKGRAMKQTAERDAA